MSFAAAPTNVGGPTKTNSAGCLTLTPTTNVALLELLDVLGVDPCGACTTTVRASDPYLNIIVANDTTLDPCLSSSKSAFQSWELPSVMSSRCSLLLYSCVIKYPSRPILNPNEKSPPTSMYYRTSIGVFLFPCLP